MCRYLVTNVLCRAVRHDRRVVGYRAVRFTRQQVLVLAIHLCRCRPAQTSAHRLRHRVGDQLEPSRQRVHAHARSHLVNERTETLAELACHKAASVAQAVDVLPLTDWGSVCPPLCLKPCPFGLELVGPQQTAWVARRTQRRLLIGQQVGLIADQPPGEGVGEGVAPGCVRRVAVGKDLIVPRHEPDRGSFGHEAQRAGCHYFAFLLAAAVCAALYCRR